MYMNFWKIVFTRTKIHITQKVLRFILYLIVNVNCYISNLNVFNKTCFNVRKVFLLHVLRNTKRKDYFLSFFFLNKNIKLSTQSKLSKNFSYWNIFNVYRYIRDAKFIFVFIFWHNYIVKLLYIKNILQYNF